MVLIVPYFLGLSLAIRESNVQGLVNLIANLFRSHVLNELVACHLTEHLLDVTGRWCCEELLGFIFR